MPRYEVVWPKGIGYRNSPALEDKAEDRIPARKGEVITGVEEAPGWIRTSENFYLPLQTPDGRQLLRTLPDFVPWRGVDDAEVADRPPSNLAPSRGGQRQGASSELDALHENYDRKYGRPRKMNDAKRVPAAASHELTTAYMHEFRHGLEDMGIDTRGDPYLEAYAPVGPADARPAIGGRVGSSHSNSRMRRGASGGALVSSSPDGSKGDAITTVGDGHGGPLALCGAMLVTRSQGSGAGQQWREGPQNALVPVQSWRSVKHGREVETKINSGRAIDLSDRNIMCMSILAGKAVMGSADHALKEVDVQHGRIIRSLYSKRYGHSEWVTTVCHCPDGRILSGGLDSKLCLWNASGVACTDLVGHVGSISKVKAHVQRNLAISAGYDRCLRAWDLHSRQEAACMKGHTAPVLDFVWAGLLVASGDRSGNVMIWDVNSATPAGSLKGHKGHITAMLSFPGDGQTPPPDHNAHGGSAGDSALVATGAQDGHIRIWDLRQKKNVFNLNAHPGGAVNEMGITLGTSRRVLVSIGADGRLLVSDPRASFSPLFERGAFTNDFLYSLLVLDDLIFTGDGHGKVTCFDVRTQDTAYTLDAGENAVRCLGATDTSLVTAGDDGNAIIFDF